MKESSTNVITLIPVNRFKHDSLSHITSLPFFKIENFYDGKASLSFDINLNGVFEHDYQIGRYCSELIIKALHDDEQEVCSPMQDIVFSYLL